MAKVSIMLCYITVSIYNFINGIGIGLPEDIGKLRMLLWTVFKFEGRYKAVLFFDIIHFPAKVGTPEVCINGLSLIAVILKTFRYADVFPQCTNIIPNG
ncbi:hypothetical protein SDC9_23834 [bioreactor metagenome]|uniref:Uncharacterized protein n=1 Tax=bioreactor metagenome TaxID=1076179 RepID=A0A644UGL1_9ZZZZ